MAKIKTETRGIVDVPLTNKERVREWRKKRAEAGGRNLSVWMEPETAEMMDRLLDLYPKENKASLVAMAIRRMYEAEDSDRGEGYGQQ
jgi:hypothetical protein